MAFFPLCTLCSCCLLLLLLLGLPPTFCQPYTSSLSLLMTIKASLDPHNLILTSWSENATDFCNGSFEGIACNEHGQVVNISLQGKGLSGQIPPEIGYLRSLSGLYLHFNKLHGFVPHHLANLTELTDLYLNVNDLSADIPPEIGHLSNLQVLQLCYNKFSGSIPSELGLLKNLTVLALQFNHLGGAIPASLGDLVMLTRLDLSSNQLSGSIPVKLADLPTLKVLDIRNNTLSGNVPIVLKGLEEGFSFANNSGLCGIGFPSLMACSSSGQNSKKPQPVGPDPTELPSKEIPESANIRKNGGNQARKSQSAVVVVVLGLFVTLGAIGLFTFSLYRRRKQKLASACGFSNNRPSSTDQIVQVFGRASSPSPLISLEYTKGWDPLASQEFLKCYMFNMDEVESATQYFSGTNLLGKGSFSAIYKGILRDGSIVAIKCISKISCKIDEHDFVSGLKALTTLKHDNILSLKGFCCSKDRGECFLIYDFVPNGNLLQYLDAKVGEQKVLGWSTRKSIIKGIAKGIEYLHGSHNNKTKLVHRNISAEKILIDQNYTPLLSDCGLHKLLAEDVIFSTLKGSAAMGYLAPEYTTTGRFTEKSDIYAFGMIIFQIMSGKSRITQLNCHGAELSRFEDFIDANLAGKFIESEAARLGEVALLCTHELPDNRPDIGCLMQELDGISSSS